VAKFVQAVSALRRELRQAQLAVQQAAIAEQQAELAVQQAQMHVDVKKVAAFTVSPSITNHDVWR
jgi:hypothetical protein